MSNETKLETKLAGDTQIGDYIDHGGASSGLAHGAEARSIGGRRVLRFPADYVKSEGLNFGIEMWFVCQLPPAKAGGLQFKFHRVLIDGRPH